MSRKNTIQKQIQKQAQAAQAAQPQLAPVAVLTVVYHPATRQVLSVQPQFPLQMHMGDVLGILRAAEQALIEDAAVQRVKDQQNPPQAASG